ncbi:receptor-interacting serine/threonine-protein kinase 3-like [Lampetra planeri]
MTQLRGNTALIGDDSLEGWALVGSGGFGHVYRAKHKDWGFHVAVKLLSDGIGTLFEEASHMNQSSCEFVLRLYGIYEGCPPVTGASVQQGIVMEFMRRGSVQSLLKDLSGPPPWPLVFRLAHQVSLAMNFLHVRNLVHHDLKPSNVLLSDDLNAKLSDFGLCRVSTSALSSTKHVTEDVGGSYKYMPPEAFEASYEPVRAFDRYSYGILLWALVTGKEPYPVADFSLVALRIPLGDRPPCEDVDQKVEGLRELHDLMKACWHQRPSVRPSFKECTEVTERVFSRHRTGIHDAVHQVLTRLHDSLMTSGAEIIQNISGVTALAERLGDMVPGETYSLILSKNTNQDKMRVLYHTTFRSGGVKVKAAFYDILRMHQPRLLERLTESFYASP